VESKQRQIIDAVAQQWQIWLERPFPSNYGGEEVAGVDLALLDTYAAGCISTFVGNRGWLDHQRHGILQQSLTDLDVVVPQLKGEVYDYFTELRDVVRQVLQCL